METLGIDIVTVILIALFTNVTTQIVKKKTSASEKELQTTNLLSGFIFGMVFFVIFGGAFEVYATYGLMGGFFAPGIYDIVTTLFDWKGASK